MKLFLEDAHHLGEKRIVLTGDKWVVRGRLKPAVAGQQVIVRVFRGAEKLGSNQVAVGADGTFRAKFEVGSAGGVRVKAVHEATPELGEVKAEPKRVKVMRPRVRRSGPSVELLQRGLKRLHYAVPRSGVYDSATARAVLAWRKVTRNRRTTFASAEVLRGVLAGKGAFKVRHPKDGRHVEADLSRQVLALIDGEKVRRIYHISSGAPATPTVIGRFKVYRKTPGTNANGMVHSSYFIGGYAMHGYASVPAYPASHGCLRLPIPNALSIYRWATMGTVVWVYR
jgi:lipoprotein-anchoring transpeptidase ErfK/SrfK